MVAMKGKGELHTFWLLDQEPTYRRDTPLDGDDDDEGVSPMHGSSTAQTLRTSTNHLQAQEQHEPHRDSFSSVGKCSVGNGKKDESPSSRPPSIHAGGCSCCNDMQANKLRRSNQSLDRQCKELHSAHSDGGYKSQNCITDCSSREGLQASPVDRNSIGLDTRLSPSPSNPGNNGKVLMTDLLLDLETEIPDKPAGDNDVSINMPMETKPECQGTVV